MVFQMKVCARSIQILTDYLDFFPSLGRCLATTMAATSNIDAASSAAVSDEPPHHKLLPHRGIAEHLAAKEPDFSQVK